jgi:hypothetical protein
MRPFQRVATHALDFTVHPRIAGVNVCSDWDFKS